MTLRCRAVRLAAARVARCRRGRPAAGRQGAPTSGATCSAARPCWRAFVYAVDPVLLDRRAEAPPTGSRELHLFTWIPVGGFQVDVGLLLDPLSMTFVLLITGVGSLIHIYSVGYMAHDPGRRRFFAYFNLFVAAMLLLVLGNSY